MAFWTGAVLAVIFMILASVTGFFMFWVEFQKKYSPWEKFVGNIVLFVIAMLFLAGFVAGINLMFK